MSTKNAIEYPLCNNSVHQKCSRLNKFDFFEGEKGRTKIPLPNLL